MSRIAPNKPQDRPLRVAIFATNPPGVYGGGRLAAFILAHCLARVGAEVAFVTNAKPVFYEDLKHFGHPGEVPLFLTRDFQTGLPEGRFDVVIIIPGQSQERLFYIGARGFAQRRGARLVLFNFETPNWFNASSPQARSEDMWIEWRRCIEDGCLVLSNSQQSMRYAEKYYTAHPDSTFFDYWHQPINVKALARVQPQYREDRIVCFIRALDPHKGGQDVIDVLCEDLRGWTLSLIVGNSTLDEGYRDAIFAAAEPFGITIDVRPLLSDIDKFIELKRARMLLYPSRFEGYGLPPIEALSVGTPCVCYDLPVFREVCGDALVAAPFGDVEALRDGVRRVIASSLDDWSHLEDAVASVASIETCGAAALHALSNYLTTPQIPMATAARGEDKVAALDPAQVMRGGWRYLRESGSAIISGWVATMAPLIRLEAFIGTRPLWVQSGISRPDVARRLRHFPEQDSGFAVHLNEADLAALDAPGSAGVTLRITTRDGVVGETLTPKWVGTGPGVPLFAPPLPEPTALPPIGALTRASCDEYGVVEFEGWAQATPRIEVIRFWSGDVLLGETVPNRLNTGVHARHRAYGDAFAGLHLAARVPGAILAAVPFRAEFLRGDDLVFARSGVTVPWRRAMAMLGSDAAVLPPGFLTDPSRPPLVAVIVSDAGLLHPLQGAAPRAMLAHLRQSGHEILLILHGNPHRFADDLSRWQALADGLVLVNPLTPHDTPAPGPDAGWNLSSAALDAVLSDLSGYPGRLRMVIADTLGLVPALSVLSLQPGLTRAVLLQPTTRPEAAAVSLAARDGTVLIGFTPMPGAPAMPPILTIGFDAPGLAAQVGPVQDPVLRDGGHLAIDATAVGAAQLAAVIPAARALAAGSGLRLAVVVDAAPLVAEAALREQLALPPDARLLWPQAIAAAESGQIAALVLPSPLAAAGPIAALAITRDIPLLNWAVGKGRSENPWRGRTLKAVLRKQAGGQRQTAARPYAALDALTDRKVPADLEAALT